MFNHWVFPENCAAIPIELTLIIYALLLFVLVFSSGDLFLLGSAICKFSQKKEVSYRKFKTFFIQEFIVLFMGTAVYKLFKILFEIKKVVWHGKYLFSEVFVFFTALIFITSLVVFLTTKRNVDTDEVDEHFLTLILVAFLMFSAFVALMALVS
jgi:hypothetical protein